MDIGEMLGLDKVINNYQQLLKEEKPENTQQPHHQTPYQHIHALIANSTTRTHTSPLDHAQKCKECDRVAPKSDCRRFPTHNNESPDEEWKFEDDDESRSETQLKNLKSIARLVYRSIKSRRHTRFKDLSEEIIPAIFNRKNKEETKNIRRRLYDAVNVMVAADVLEKEHSTYIFSNRKKLHHSDQSPNADFPKERHIRERKAALEKKKKCLNILRKTRRLLDVHTNKNKYFKCNRKDVMEFPLFASSFQEYSLEKVSPSALSVTFPNEPIHMESGVFLLENLYGE